MEGVGVKNAVKTAVLGGTFDPVHRGHLALIHEVAANTDYTHFVLLPAALSNFKRDSRPVASDKERLTMLRLALSDYKSIYPEDLNVEIDISEIEIHRGGVSYTYDTVMALKKELGDPGLNTIPAERGVENCSAGVDNSRAERGADNRPAGSSTKDTERGEGAGSRPACADNSRAERGADDAAFVVSNCSPQSCGGGTSGAERGEGAGSCPACAGKSAEFCPEGAGTKGAERGADLEFCLKAGSVAQSPTESRPRDDDSGSCKDIASSDRIGFIIGDDHIERLGNWYKYDLLINEVEFLICPRQCDEAVWSRLDSAVCYKRINLEKNYVENSTDLRRDFLKYSFYLSPSVRDYAMRNEIYYKRARTTEELSAHLKKTVSEKRYIHSIGVAETTARILCRYGLSADVAEWNGFSAAEFCGLSHDLARETVDSVLLRYCREAGLPLTEDEVLHPVLAHGIVSADIARHLCGEYPEEWRRAIQVHTTGDTDMSPLALALFAADFIEPSRIYLDDEKRAYYLSKPTLESLVYVVLCDMMAHWSTRADITATEKTLRMKAALENSISEESL